MFRRFFLKSLFFSLTLLQTWNKKKDLEIYISLLSLVTNLSSPLFIWLFHLLSFGLFSWFTSLSVSPFLSLYNNAIQEPSNSCCRFGRFCFSWYVLLTFILLWKKSTPNLLGKTLTYALWDMSSNFQFACESFICLFLSWRIVITWKSNLDPGRFYFFLR